MNEFFDLPHLLMGGQAATWNQCSGEIIIEVIIFILVVGFAEVLFRRLFERIQIIEGLLPICDNC